MQHDNLVLGENYCPKEGPGHATRVPDFEFHSLLYCLYNLYMPLNLCDSQFHLQMDILIVPTSHCVLRTDCNDVHKVPVSVYRSGNSYLTA